MNRMFRCVAMGFCCLALSIHAEILGRKPGYLFFGASSVPNEQAITRHIRAPGLDEGYVPQGVAIDGDYVLRGAYRSTDTKVDKGPCRVFGVEIATGKRSRAARPPTASSEH